VASAGFRYAIVGAGVAGAAAVRGIREWDEGSILLVGAEPHPPYHRPPLTKDLWFGRTSFDGIWVAPAAFFADNHVELVTGTRVTALDLGRHELGDDHGRVYRYDKLLVATGGEPRRLAIPGGELGGVCYYRTVDDYVRARDRARPGSPVVVIGGGFLGSELAAALAGLGVDVTMIFPQRTLVPRALPAELGRALVERYVARGVRMLTGDAPVAIERRGDGLRTRTRRGRQIESELVIVGIGITPSVELARRAGLQVADGIVVDEYLRASDPDVYAAGDNALFPSPFLDERRRIEHWDGAQSQGELAGANMAGRRERYDYLPYLSSELFEVGYEAVGHVSTALDTWVDWDEPATSGTVYYLRQGRVEGVLLYNRPEKLDAARELIRRSVPGDEEDLHWAL
jgi:NADPH-dependent 2,4-dienoyl-CoA reductase/sulfur reductase-like enzyme